MNIKLDEVYLSHINKIEKIRRGDVILVAPLYLMKPLITRIKRIREKNESEMKLITEPTEKDNSTPKPRKRNSVTLGVIQCLIKSVKSVVKNIFGVLTD